MNKTCARCQKTVYPIEELKCLDKIWHKGCFKCQECGMTLNMKTYKGYGKLPYCEAHVPKAKHTTMAETPELKRIAENTKLQSNVSYHADFERTKGKFTQVADDPETLRIKANTQIISNVAYHGELAKKAAMEKQRTLNENGELIELPTPDNYDIQIESYAADMRPPSIPPPSVPPTTSYQPPKQHQYPSPSDYTNSNQQYRNQQKYDQPQQKYDPPRPKYDQTQPNYNQTQPNYNQPQPRYDQSQSRYDHSQPRYDETPKYDQSQMKFEQTQPRYDQNQPKYDQSQPKYDATPKFQQNYQQPPQPSYPMQSQMNPTYTQKDYQYNYQPNVPINAYPTQKPYDEYARQSRDMIQREQYGVHAQGYQQPQNHQQRIGKIEDYDPVTDGPRQQVYTQRPSATLIYNSSERNNGRGANQQSQGQSRRPIGNVTDMDPLAAERDSYRQHQLPRGPPASKVYRAMYDYVAADTDEVSFEEGDLISNVTSIDEGWMTGQVLRTGRTGMLPANYVEVEPM